MNNADEHQELAQEREAQGESERESGEPKMSCSQLSSREQGMASGGLNQAKTSATTRAGSTLVSFCSSPWKEYVS